MLKILSPVLVLLALCATSAADELLPRPAGLEPNVSFWTRIYSEVDGDGGFIHDSEHLDVVYEVMRFESGLSSRSQEKRTDAAKARVRGALRVLASGKRTGLTPGQERILALWPRGTSNSTLSRAAKHIRFQLGQADKFKAGLIRQGAWKPFIEQTLVDHGVPKDLGALPHVESSFNARAYSRVGAAGLWQFTRSTGRRYLRVDSVVDDRLDPLRATEAAARLLRDNYKSLGVWPLAITAYNHGTSGMRRAVRKTGSNDIATISKKYKSRTFGFASRNFYAEFLAARDIDADPARYFGPLRREHPIAVEVVKMPHYYDAKSLARALGIDLERLREFNPSLRPSVWSGSKYVPRGHELRIPEGSTLGPIHVALEKISTSERYAKQHRDRLYKVRNGDSLSLIASRYGVSVGELVALNNLRSRHNIHAGQVLVLPDDASSALNYAKRWDMPSDGTYTVRTGDSISGIAKGFGIPEAELVSFNDLVDPHRISIGQKIRITKPAMTPASPQTLAVRIPDEVEPRPTPSAQREPEPEIAAVVAQPPQAPTALALADRPEASLSAVEDAQPLAEPVAPEVDVPAPTTADLVAALDFEATPDEPALFLEAFPSEQDLEDPEMLEEDALLETESADANMGPLSDPPPDPLPRGQLPDPSNYEVSDDDRIVVQADETLGHYADWLDVRTSRLRSLNRMSRNSTVVIGRRAVLDFSHVSRETFERRRLEYHRTLQEEFFGSFTVTGTETHILRQGDTMWVLARQKYKLPVWLLRQYNPDLDFATLSPGSRMVIPSVEPRPS